MDELVFDAVRSAIVRSTVRAFAADDRATPEVERLLVHVARTASTQDLVDVAYDLAARALSSAAWSALCDEPWLAAELDAVAGVAAPVEVRLVVTGATPEEVQRLVDDPFEALGEALGLLGDPDAAAAVTTAVGQQDAAPCPDESDEPGVDPRRSGHIDVDEGRGFRLSRVPTKRPRGRREAARRAAAASRPTANRRRLGTATAAAWRGSTRNSRAGPAVAGGRGPRLPSRPGATGSRSRDGPIVVTVHRRGRDVECAHRGGARTVAT